MRANKIERRKELECTILQREKEMEALRQRKAELEDELGKNSEVTDGGDFATSFPVLEYCGPRPRKDLRQLPFEQMGYIKVEFEMAAKAIAKNNRILQQQLKELKRQIELEGRRCAKVREKTQTLADTTGVKVGDTPQGKSNGEKSRKNGDNGEGSHGDKMTPKTLEARRNVIAKEIRAGRLLVRKKEDALIALTDKVESRHELRNKLDALYNDIRVTDRDIRFEKETLQNLIAEHDDVSQKIKEIMESNASSSSLLIQDDIAAIKGEIDETANGTRRGQDRVMKAQDFRIEQLERRLESIQKALRNNHVMRGVESYLTQGWVSGGNLIQLESEDDMYDIENIIPAHEKCHPAIYNLLLMEKERISRRVRLLGDIAVEKESVIDALACKAEVKLRECQQAIQGLDQIAAGAAYEEKMQRLKAAEYIEERRVHYSDLFMEMRKLKLKALEISRKPGPRQ